MDEHQQPAPQGMEGVEQANPQAQVLDPQAAYAELAEALQQQRLQFEAYKKQQEDAQLARQLQASTSIAPAGKQEGVRVPEPWNPKSQSWAEYSTTLSLYLINLAVNQRLWGLRALTFLPDAAKQAFFRLHNLLPQEASPETCSWDRVTAFCTEHQVAHLQTNSDLRAQLTYRLRQYNPQTGVTTSLGDHLAALEAVRAKCTIPLDEGTAVFVLHNSLHPAIKSMVQINPATAKEFDTYDSLRLHLVKLGGVAEKAIADYERDRRHGRPKQQGKQQPQPFVAGAAKALATTGGVTKPRSRHERNLANWSEEQRELAVQGLCVHCKSKWTPNHRCLSRKVCATLLDTTASAPDSSDACAPSHTTAQEACTPASEPVLMADNHTDTPAVTHTTPAEPEPTLDELIEAYVAFDTLWQHEKDMQAKFVTDAIDRAERQRLTTMRTRTSKRIHFATASTPATAPGSDLNPNHSYPTEEDRRIIPSEFQELQTLLDIQFTLDACANADGSNALCPRYCSAEDSFLATDLANEVVWLNPPFGQLQAYLEHFLSQKEQHPELSGAVLLPVWRSNQHHPLLDHMRLVKTYPKGFHLFDSPRTAPSARRRLPGLPWPVQVWYCPPAPSTTPAPGHTPARLPMAYKCRVNGAKAVVLLDTGAEGHAYLSKRFCDLFGLTPTPTGLVPHTVELADGTDVDTFGRVSVSVHLQGFVAKKLTCTVCDLTPHFDLILGSDWLMEHKAVLDLASVTCTLFPPKGGKVVLQGSKPSQPLHADPTPAEPAEPADTSRPNKKLLSLLLSGKQLQRLMRKPSTKAFIATVREVKSDTQLSDDPTVQALLTEYSDVFSMEIPPFNPDAPREVTLTIPTEPGAKPPSRPLYRYSPREYEAIKEYITELVNKGLIQPSISPYGAPVIFVPKPDGSLRMCIDYRALNKQTLRNQGVIPNINDLLDKLSGATTFTSLDLVGGYYQLPIHPDDIHKTAFKTPLGLYEFKVLPMGLTNSPAVFQRAMNSMFKDKIDRYVLVYLDDILVFSKTPEEHVHHLRSVLQTLREHQYYIKPTKCDFFKPELKYLGHIVSAEGIKPDPKKVEAIAKWPVPNDTHQLRTFLGLSNYFRRFIQGYSKLVLPLTDLLQHTTPYRWTPQCQHAFDTLKHALITAPILKSPDFSKPFTVVVDASESNLAVGAVLMQGDHVIAYDSKKCTPAEQNYTTTELEMLAVVRACDIWRCYLHGPKFKLVTDHHPNTFFHTQKDLHNKRHARWADELAAFDFEFEYRPGRLNVADPLSRAPHSASLSLLVNTLLAGRGDHGAAGPRQLGPRLNRSTCLHP